MGDRGEPDPSCVCVGMQLVPTSLTLLYTMTEREADNFGIFFREVLRSIQGWWVSAFLFADMPVYTCPCACVCLVCLHVSMPVCTLMYLPVCNV